MNNFKIKIKSYEIALTNGHGVIKQLMPDQQPRKEKCRTKKQKCTSRTVLDSTMKDQVPQKRSTVNKENMRVCNDNCFDLDKEFLNELMADKDICVLHTLKPKEKLKDISGVSKYQVSNENENYVFDKNKSKDSVFTIRTGIKAPTLINWRQQKPMLANNISDKPKTEQSNATSVPSLRSKPIKPKRKKKSKVTYKEMSKPKSFHEHAINMIESNAKIYEINNDWYENVELELNDRKNKLTNTSVEGNGDGDKSHSAEARRTIIDRLQKLISRDIELIENQMKKYKAKMESKVKRLSHENGEIAK